MAPKISWARSAASASCKPRAFERTSEQGRVNDRELDPRPLIARLTQTNQQARRVGGVESIGLSTLKLQNAGGKT